MVEHDTCVFLNGRGCTLSSDHHIMSFMIMWLEYRI